MNTLGLLTLGITLVAQIISMPQGGGRDPRTGPATGTSSIAGTLTTSDQVAQPVRRARIVLTGADVPIDRTVYTDETGKFAIGNLPSGRYTLAATKPGFVRAAYG